MSKKNKKRSHDSEVRIELNKNAMEALSDACLHLAMEYVAENAHEELLLCHLKRFLMFLHGKMENDQHHYNFKIQECEALAFCQIWAGMNCFPHELARVVVLRVYEAITKQHSELNLKYSHG